MQASDRKQQAIKITTMTDFTEKFLKYSNTELLQIIDSPDDYQPIGVEAAKTILASRQLSDKDIEIATAELHALKQERIAKKQKQIDLENKLKNNVDSLISMFNPIQSGTPNSDKVIKIVSMIFGGLFLFKLYKDFGLISFMFTDSGAKWDFSLVLYILPMLFVPTATVLFFKRKKIGWTLLAIFLSYSVVCSIGLIILTIIIQPSSLPNLDNIFPETTLSTHIMTLLFFVGTLWTICKEDIRAIYTINKEYMFKTFGIITIITVITTYRIFM